MGKFWIEVCLISARGLRRSSLLKLQRYAVGWIDPSEKYCTGIDASGTANPVWKTKFSALVDANSQDLACHIEVYCREPIFLRESLLGTATVVLKEFLDKYMKNTDISKPFVEVGSFQLRKHNSNKPHGFIDVSIRVCEEGEEPSSLTGNEGGGIEVSSDHSHGTINLTTTNQYLPPDPAPFLHQAGTNTNIYSQPGQFPINYASSSVGHPNYPPPPGTVNYMPPPLPLRAPAPPPSSGGYILPRPIYSTNLPPSGASALMQGGWDIGGQCSNIWKRYNVWT
ncbi:uncharacterized protein LOC124923945 [Impatiens glandulifera]|uniref:uncharacterized protein LOC124923945 n=1 Tax=Impatiens glandulifera TaxID=253017 RepID=UPI001FB0E535|nr:uncharacterized protein LOC124923945 [Impatiens glandulifera]